MTRGNIPASGARKRRLQTEHPQLLPHQEVMARFNVRVIGRDKPPLLFCNGFGCNQHVWRYLTAALATNYQLVLFDYIGTGGADLAAYDPTKYASLDGYAQDVVDICRALDLQGATIIGHSVGATIAMLAANAAPEHFTKVVLVAASPCYLNEPGYRGGFDLADVEQLLTLFDAADHSWANPFASLLMGPTNAASAMEELAGFFCEMNPTVACQLARVTFLADNRADVARLNLPTLVLQCTHDIAVPPEVAAYLLHHLPQGTLVQLQAMGHCPHLSAPTETLAALEAFLLPITK
ncbi:alpha/beta fold hydrolase [Hymenobacter negativus]|uniref:Alpha/beta hydrolase n=1 Tax=Hymenobacter negativus TaxID=2795026 RepID=A0ABS3QDE5_9BACT|nr:alpha/beta hydrolase [Hymenobacter negativus]MBO2008844.1 alpha/beta hydrolase [Hymenobacter negativus]